MVLFSLTWAVNYSFSYYIHSAKVSRKEIFNFPQHEEVKLEHKKD